MCSPKVSQPTQYQTAQTPVYRESGERRTTGRRSTILTGGTGVVSTDQMGGKKTILGT